MTADTDKFVVASFALWAGDTAYVRSVLSDDERERVTFKTLRSIDAPEDIVSIAATLRLRQLAQKRGEFNRYAQDQLTTTSLLTDEARVLVTPHLRATVWRIGTRDFVLQGYLADLDWEDAFFSNVAVLAADANSLDTQPAPTEPSALERVDKQIGGSWVIEGNPFLRVDVTDMGVFEVQATWVVGGQPQNSEQVEAPLRAVLTSLESPVRSTTQR